jgi:hypothetical protein
VAVQNQIFVAGCLFYKIYILLDTIDFSINWGERKKKDEEKDIDWKYLYWHIYHYFTNGGGMVFVSSNGAWCASYGAYYSCNVRYLQCRHLCNSHLQDKRDDTSIVFCTPFIKQ